MSDRERDHLPGDDGDPVEPLSSGVPSTGAGEASGGAPLREAGESGRPVMLWGRIEDPRSWAPGETPTARAAPSADAPDAREAPREVPEWARLGDGVPGGPGQPPEKRPVHPGEVFVATGAGILAALFAAVVWGLMARATGSELQVAAVGVGFAAGLGVAAAGRRGSPFTTVAVIATAVGVFVGKYLSFAFVFEEQIGFLVGHDVGIFSGATFDAFRDRLGDVFSLFDVIWFVVAVVAALLVAGGSSQRADADGAAARRHHHPMDRFTKGLPGAVRVTVDWAVTIAGAIGIVLLVKAFVVNPYRIPSSSMEPTLHCAFGESGCLARFSDRVLANRFIYHFRNPRRGEIIVFETPPEARNRCGAGGTFVKRLIGLPGETIEIRLEDGNGYVFINGQQLPEPYVKEDRRQLTQGYGPTTIPENHYFMMGDNREASCDSRDWGTVPRGNLIGNVFATYWPPQRISFH